MGWFNRKKKSGWVYTAVSTRPDGSKKIYTGKTSRSPYERWGEHMDSVKEHKSTWTGGGSFFKPIGARWSSNASKAERTVKQMSPEQKRAFGRSGARKYYRKKSWY
jgi:predicted GIY-YIG superfamily endonuclease